MRILHLEKNCYPQRSLDLLKPLGDVEFREFDDVESYRKYLSVESFDVIFTKLGIPVGKEEMELQRELKFVITPTTGLNHIDLDEASKRGIEVISLKGESSFLSEIQSTSEHTWMLLLSLIRNLGPATRSVSEGNWERQSFLADELNTATIGIIGMGRLGKILARYAHAFDMRVIYCDVDATAKTDDSVAERVNFESLLRQSDYVILQVDYRPENFDMMNASSFDLMKEGAYFINTSRGEMVNEDDLLSYLKSGHVKGAALDVLQGDSSWSGKCDSTNNLIDYAKQNDNLIITPHMGGYGKISIEKTREFVLQKFIAQSGL